MALSIDVLRNGNFRFLMAARICGMFALQAQDVIIGWQVYSITHKPLMLGLVGLTEAVPAIIFALFTGHIVDVGRPHRIYQICVGLLMLNMLSLFLFAGGIIPIATHHTLLLLFVGIFLSGCMRSFIMPASFTLLSRIVPRGDMPAASAWLTSGFQVAAISGPAIAGLIYGGYGVQHAWALPVFFMGITFLTVSRIGREHRQYRNAVSREPAVESIKAGWRFILGNRVLLSVMSLDMFAVLFGGAVAMLPAFADQVLHTDAAGLGLLRASPAIGSVLMGLTLALNPLKKIKATTLLWTVVGFGCSIIAFGLSDTFWVSAVCLAASGAFDSVSMVIRGTLMQLLTPDTMRGRVSSVNSMFITSSNEIGAFESGAAASLFGLVPSIIIGGFATLGVVAITALLSPQFRRTVVATDDKKA